MPSAAEEAVPLAWLALLLIGLGAVFVGAAAIRQRRRSGATWGRAAAAFALGLLLSALPAALACGLELVGIAPPPYWSAVIATALAIRLAVDRVGPRGFGHLAPFEGGAVVEAIARLASRWGMRPLRAWKLRSGGSKLEMQAAVFGLADPIVIVADGVEHGMTPLERDAILAHELAHVATRSLWVLLVVPAVALAVGLAIGSRAHPVDALALSFALAFGARRIAGRRFELACDRLAAEAVGADAAVDAIDKIHRVQQVAAEGWLSRSFYATATHPSRAVRLAALRPTRFDAIATKERRLARLAGVAFAALMAIAALASHGGPRWLVLVPCACVLGAPALLHWLVLRGHFRHEIRRLGRRRALHVAGRLLVLLAWPVALTVVLVELETAFVILAAWIAVGAIVFALTRRTRALRRRLDAAWQRDDYAAIVREGEAAGPLLTSDPPYAHGVALARALTGDRAGAIAALEDLRAREPAMPLPTLTLSVVLLAVDPARARAEAVAAARLLPADVLPHVRAARASLALGDLDNAAVSLRIARTIDPAFPSVAALEALLAIERRDFTAAADASRRALALGPADALALIARAKLALATEDVEVARGCVEAALSAAAAAPLSFVQPDADALASELRVRVGP